MTKDFSVKITVRNGRLLAAIRAKYGTVAKLCRQCGLAPQTVSGLLTMRLSPISQRGDWSQTAYSLSSALDMEPEALWPAHLAQIKLAKNEVELDMGLDEVRQLTTGDNYASAMKAIARWSKHIKPRHMQALVMLANGASRSEAAERLGVSGARVDQLARIAASRIRTRARKEGVRKIGDIPLAEGGGS